MGYASDGISRLERESTAVTHGRGLPEARFDGTAFKLLGVERDDEARKDDATHIPAVQEHPAIVATTSTGTISLDVLDWMQALRMKYLGHK